MARTSVSGLCGEPKQQQQSGLEIVLSLPCHAYILRAPDARSLALRKAVFGEGCSAAMLRVAISSTHQLTACAAPWATPSGALELRACKALPC